MTTTPRVPRSHPPTATTPAPRHNQFLAAALDQAGWTPRDLIRALNPRLDAAGETRLHPTAAYSWLRGSTPRSPVVRRLTTTVLTEATGTPCTTALWGPGHKPVTEPTATDHLLGSRTLPAVLDTTAAWVTSPDQHITAHPAPPDRLTTAVWDATHHDTTPPPPRPSGPDRVPPPLADVLEDQLHSLRRLDDRTGGGPLSQRHVRLALGEVIHLLRTCRYDAHTGTRLLRTAAGHAQLAGWMAFDADLTAAAQRYQLLAIRLARAAGDHDTVANVLGMLSYQHAAHAQPDTALRFAAAAVEHTARGLPLVRARALGRLATAHASAGDIDNFRRATDQCHTLLQRRSPADPPSLYYFTAEQVAAESGQALVDLAAAHPGRARRLLAEATELLSPLAHQTSAYRRSALLHSIHLARARLLSKDPHATAQSLTTVADRLPHVQSVRCRLLLTQLGRHARRHLCSADRATAIQALERAVSTP
ncbi:hypothetical protein ABT354_19355 [Streptomyces sp. NPDC000594]|uniref:hypothetical protein n=1 Tax=Streptomyces sp. NPDC000594 TaxID=3154261 RepID=UPI00332E1FC3